MATYSTTQTLENSFEGTDPIERLAEFFRTNGYFRRDDELPDDGAGDDEPDRQHAVFVRGQSAAGWWASNMTKLPTRVEVDRRGERLDITYEIDVTGQHFTDEDRDFWQRELEAACEYLRNPSRTPRDLRHEEAKRAERIRRRMLSYGIWGAIAAFVLIVLVKLLTSY